MENAFSLFNWALKLWPAIITEIVIIYLCVNSLLSKSERYRCFMVWNGFLILMGILMVLQGFLQGTRIDYQIFANGEALMEFISGVLFASIVFTAAAINQVLYGIIRLINKARDKGED